MNERMQELLVSLLTNLSGSASVVLNADDSWQWLSRVCSAFNGDAQCWPRLPDENRRRQRRRVRNQRPRVVVVVLVVVVVVVVSRIFSVAPLINNFSLR